MALFLLDFNSLAAGLTRNRPRDPLSRIPRWVWILGLALILVILGIIIKLRAEEETGEPRRHTGRAPFPPTPEPPKPATEAEPVQPAVEPEPAAASPDNLKRVKGIGPKIETLLKENGITTFTQLAETEVSRLQALLVETGWARLANPTTWPEQARTLAGKK